MRIRRPNRDDLAALPLVAFLGILFGLAIYLPHYLKTSAIDPSFELQSSKGGSLRSRDLEGKPYLVFFGYTRCPDVCPTTLADLSAVLSQARAAGRPVTALFVTVDPARDTVQALREFVSSFDSGIVGLTGTPSQIDRMARHFGAAYKRVPQADGDYVMLHPAVVYLINAEGRFRGFLPVADHRKALSMLMSLGAPAGVPSPAGKVAHRS